MPNQEESGQMVMKNDKCTYENGDEMDNKDLDLSETVELG